MRAHMILIILSAWALLHGADARRNYNTSARRVEGKLNVHLIPHTHDDGGWLKSFDQYYYGHRQDIQTAGVQYILDTVVQALLDNPDRKFMYGEMSFFMKWYGEQHPETQALVRRLVAAGQLHFINGGAVQHDEAAAHYVAMIDQTTRGHRFLNRTFGVVPTVGWQIDPFGHSATHASLMCALVGFDALFFGRADYQDMAARTAARELEMVWRGSASWGAASDVFTHNYVSGNYGPPSSFDFNWGDWDEPIIDDPLSADFNVERRVAEFEAAVEPWVAATRGSDILLMMGSDFEYANADSNFVNLDKVIHYVNLLSSRLNLNVFYSTPAAYVAAKAADKGMAYPVKRDDFFPYADCAHCYWTGYFTSRPASKGYIRAATARLNAARQLQLLAALPPSEGSLDLLEFGVALTQHHDAITGTEKQAVANDYHRTLAMGIARADAVIHAALLRLLFGDDAGGRDGSSDGGGAEGVEGDGGGAAAGAVAPLALPQRRLSSSSPSSTSSWESASTAGTRTPWWRRLLLRARATAALPNLDGGAGGGAASAAEEAAEGPAAAVAATPPREGAAAQTEPSSPPPLPRVHLASCPLLNISVCPASVAASAGHGFLAVVYNPLAWQRRAYLRIPVASAAGAFTVTDSAGHALPSQLCPASAATLAAQRATLLVEGVGGGGGGDSAEAAAAAEGAALQELALAVDLPPLGYETLYVRPVAASAAAAAAATSPGVSVRATRNAGAPRLPISNAALTLTFNATSGALAGAAAADGAWQVALSHRLLWYESSQGSPDSPQASGAYIFRSQDLDAREAGGQVEVEIVAGPVVTEVRQRFSQWAALTTRLWEGAEHLEAEWTVGPLPLGDKKGREVISRITTDLDTGGIVWTDANGREMLRRQRDWRPTWSLEQGEEVAGNYYPITAGAAISDSRVALALATDRAQGAASLRDGELEVMVHRTTVVDDGRGVGENLAETASGCRDCASPGLVVRGTHALAMGPADEVAAPARRLQALLNDPVVLAFAALPAPEEAAAAAGRDGEAAREGRGGGEGEGLLGGGAQRQRQQQQQQQPWRRSRSQAGAATAPGGDAEGPAAVRRRLAAAAASGAANAPSAGVPDEAVSAAGAVLPGVRGRWSGLGAVGALPPNVHLVTLMRADGEGEGIGGTSGAAEGAAPERVILRLAHTFQVDEATERLSAPAVVDLAALLAGRTITSLTELNLSAARPKHTLPPRLRWRLEPDPLGANRSTPAAPPPRGGGGATLLGGRMPGEGAAWDVWRHEGEGGAVVELYPMEIRTWEVLLA